MGLFKKHVKSLVVVIALMVFARTQEALGDDENFLIPTNHTLVRVCNKLGKGLNFNIHCKSKDDDLGTHEVADEMCYEWKFRVNFWETTLYFCNLKCRDGDGEGTWDLYKAKRDMGRCVRCLWEVKGDGLHGYTDWGLNDLLFKWPKPAN